MQLKMLVFLLYLIYLLHTKVISCPTDAFLSYSGDKCYFVPEGLEKWMLGEKACQTYGGHLASIENAFDNLWLTSELQKTFNSENISFWLGGNDVDSPGVWQWTDGSTLKYSNWASGNPINSSATNCMLLNISNGRWYSESCFYSTFCVCEIYSNTSTIYPTSKKYPTTITTAALTTATPFPYCDGARVQINSQCLWFEPSPKNWNDSSKACHGNGGVLVTVLNQSDTDFLYSQAQTVPFFIGLTDLDNIGFFIWDQPQDKTLTLADTQYTNWAIGQPDLSNANYRCIIDQKGHGWMVCSCDVSAFYACSKPANYLQTSTKMIG